MNQATERGFHPNFLMCCLLYFDVLSLYSTNWALSLVQSVQVSIQACSVAFFYWLIALSWTLLQDLILTSSCSCSLSSSLSAFAILRFVKSVVPSLRASSRFPTNPHTTSRAQFPPLIFFFLSSRLHCLYLRNGGSIIKKKRWTKSRRAVFTLSFSTRCLIYYILMSGATTPKSSRLLNLYPLQFPR